MRFFLLTYWLTTALLFIVFYWEGSPISTIVNNGQTDLVTFLVSQVLPDGMMNDYHILISSNYSLVIEKACNGMILYLFFLAPILAFPATREHKVKWAIGGYFVILAVNVFRIWLITQLVLEERRNFSFAHDYFGNALLITTAMVLFVLFIKSREKVGSKKTNKEKEREFIPYAS
ncbi:MAG: archaeosortase/exosortase family protein [Sulfurovaceae bacterium]|nr:archaeosortase/exosortase family protein [Sulfurovaceae bacterium]